MAPKAAGQEAMVTRVHVLSLASKSIVYSIELGSSSVCDLRIDVNGRYLALSLRHPSSIRVYAISQGFPLLATYTDVHDSPVCEGPIMEIGPRFIAYTTSMPYQKSNSKQLGVASNGAGASSVGVDGLELPEDDGSGAHGRTSVFANGVISNAGQVATKVAKEIASGVKVIGEFGYHTISNYFAGPPAAPPGAEAAGSSQTSPRFLASAGRADPHQGRAGHTSDHPARRERRRDPRDGVVLIRLLPAVPPVASQDEVSDGRHPLPDPSEPATIISHFKPHSNPVGIMQLDPSQTWLMTASVEGTSIYVWDLSGLFSRSLYSNSGASYSLATGHASGSNGHASDHALASTRASALGAWTSHRRRIQPGQPECIYRCDRGYTSATIEHISVSFDGKWIAASTARGTTHVFNTDFPADAQSASSTSGSGSSIAAPGSTAVGGIAGMPSLVVQNGQALATNGSAAFTGSAGLMSGMNMAGGGGGIGGPGAALISSSPTRRSRSSSSSGKPRAAVTQKLGVLVRLSPRSSFGIVKDLFVANDSGQPAFATASAAGTFAGAEAEGARASVGGAGGSKSSSAHSSAPAVTGAYNSPSGASGNIHMSVFMPSPSNEGKDDENGAGNGIARAGGSLGGKQCQPARQRVLVWDPSLCKLSLFWIDTVPVDDFGKRASTLPPAVAQILASLPRATVVRSMPVDGASEFKILVLPVLKWTLLREPAWDEAFADDQVRGLQCGLETTKADAEAAPDCRDAVGSASSSG
ncbi:Breast carcinoma amplified sequence 3 [Polyrhizophydium stewartii]|uniref:Breast carcinoma amplified sequence 3 n=1 Tax=Polyrhizophydium stewartii TaxID=2732419 RepID=A0ABR4N5X9_9FUNG